MAAAEQSDGPTVITAASADTSAGPRNEIAPSTITDVGDRKLFGIACTFLCIVILLIVSTFFIARLPSPTAK